MSTNGFSISFVLQADSFSKTGYIYNQDVSSLNPARFADSLEARKDYFAGGYCFVIDNHIWNAKSSVMYDPKEAYCHVDDLSYALMFLQLVVDYLPVNKAVECPLLEMVVVKVRYEDERILSLVGVATNGSVVYEKCTVESSAFFTELRDATEAYIRFAQELSESVERSKSLRVRTKRSLVRKLQLSKWVAAADRLRRLVTDIKSE